MAALIGALRATLSADTANFEAGMKKAQRTAATTGASIQKSMVGIGASVKSQLTGFATGLAVGLAAALGSAIKSSLEYASSLAEVAQQLGVTARDLQVFRFAAGQVGVSQEQLETGLSKLTITLGKVAAGAKEPAKALAAIGVSIDELKGKDTGEAFRIIADGLQKVTDRSQRAAVEVALFGKTGSKLDNLLAGGSRQVNELAQAAEKLGIVLSDQQIQNADQTADKLRALWTVLKARIASDVADNASSILELANMIADLAAQAVDAGNKVHAFFAELSNPQNSIASRFFQGLGQDIHGNYYNPGATVSAKLPPPKMVGASQPYQPIAQFLGGGGGKKKGAEDHSAQDALRNAFQFDQQLRRAQMDVLHATQDLATDYVERTAIGIEILNAEKDARDAEHRYEVALYGLTKGKEGQSAEQVRQLQFEEDKTDALARLKLLQDQEEQRQKDYDELGQHDFERRKETLESQAAIATTAAQRRKIELELLDLAYEQKRQALQNILNTSKDFKEIEDARRDLENLNKTYANDRQGVMNATRGPLEDWAASIPKSADEITQAFQQIQVDGLEGLTSSIMDVITGTKSLKDAFGSLAKSVVADILQMTVKMLIFRAVSSAIGSLGNFGWMSGAKDTTASLSVVDLPSFAGGGSIGIRGRGGTDRNILSMNGVPIARVSHGERLDIHNDNVSGGSAQVTIVPTPYFDAVVDNRAVRVAAPMAGQAAMMGATGGVMGMQRRAARTLP